MGGNGESPEGAGSVSPCVALRDNRKYGHCASPGNFCGSVAQSFAEGQMRFKVVITNMELGIRFSPTL